MTQAYDPAWQRKINLFRRRFRCRTDVFSVKYTSHREVPDEVTGEMRTEEYSKVSPQCDNYWKPVLCQIRENRGGCSDCPNKKHAAFTDEWASRHIRGEKELVLFMLTQEGIYFGACDFDRGNPFEDAKLCHDYSVNILRLPCYIARSSKKGYHLYWFFSEPVQAHLFTSMTRKIFQDVGIHTRAMTNPEYPVPEVFPKQTTFQDDRIGNGIKIPMIEPKFKEGFNCWVDQEAVPLPLDKQWECFHKMEEISPSRFDETLAAHQVEIIQRAHSRNPHRESKSALVDGKYTVDGEDRVKTGDVYKTIKRCPALAQFFEKDEGGNYKFDQNANEKGVPNAARVAALGIALNTANGEEFLLEQCRSGRKNWDETTTMYQYNLAKEKGYSPITCRWMQENHLCKIGIHPKLHRDPKDETSPKDHCLKKNPPIMFVGGTRITNPDQLPENEWPEPSPIRFATMHETASCEEIIKLLDTLFTFRMQKVPGQEGKEEKAPPPADLTDRFHNLVRQSRRLKPEEHKRIQEHIKAHHYMPAKELDKVEKQVAREVRAEHTEARKKVTRNFSFNSIDFYEEDNCYTMSYLDAKGIPQNVQLTNFIIQLKEEIVQYERVDDGEDGAVRMIENRYYTGEIVTQNDAIVERHAFRARPEEWGKGSETFSNFIRKEAGTSVLFKGSSMDDIRNCVHRFNTFTVTRRKRTRDIGHFRINGKNLYLMPSVIVTADAITTNTEYEIRFEDDLCKNLNFRVLDDVEFKDLALHIVNDYFPCHNQVATMTAFGHAMAAAMGSFMPLNKSPVLWLSGDFSCGKTFVAEAAQCFFGNFQEVMNTGGSAKAKIGVADYFRDATLLIDDFKQAMEAWGGKDIISFIQNAYDKSGRAVLNRDSSLKKKTARVKGNILFTGEEVPTQEASAISRMIIIDVQVSDKNREHGDIVRERRKEYCGFTPYFIQHVLNLPEKVIKAIYKEYRDHLEAPIKKNHQNEGSQRIAENLAYNMTAFRLAMDMIYSRGVISVEQRDQLCAQHLKNLEITRTSIISYVGAQRGATMFLETVRELLQNPAKYHLWGWPGYSPIEHRNSTMIGFWREGEPDEIKILPKAAIAAVNDLLSKNKQYAQSEQHIGRQLNNGNHLVAGRYDRDSKSFLKQVQSPHNGQRNRVWCIKARDLGLTPAGQIPDVLPEDAVDSVANLKTKTA